MHLRVQALLVALCFAPAPARALSVFTLEDDFPFEVTIPANNSVIRGTFHAMSPEEFASWDLTTSGQDASAPPGTHACADLGFNPSASCPMTIEFVGDQAELVVFRLSLAGDSGPVSQTGPSFSTFVDDAAGGSAYIISADSADRVPASSSGGFFQFQNFSAGTNPAFFIQPGESTVWLLSRYELGEITGALEGGATVRMELRDNSALTGGLMHVLTSEIRLVSIPEPDARLLQLFVLSGVAVLRAGRRRRDRALPGR